MRNANAVDHERLSDLELAALAVARDPAAIRLIIRRNNQRLFRTAWSVLRNRGEAEEAVQEGYLKAFRALSGYSGASALATWLTRIVLNEAIGRRRAAERQARLRTELGVVALDDYRQSASDSPSRAPSPEGQLMQTEIGGLLTRAVAALPEMFRQVFVLREVEGLSVEETAEVLGVPPATVKTRLLRARRRLQQELDPDLGAALRGALSFAGADCEALTRRVLDALTLNPDPETKP